MPAAVMGTPEALDKNAAEWVLTLAHEMFHVFQVARGSMHRSRLSRATRATTLPGIERSLSLSRCKHSWAMITRDELLYQTADKTPMRHLPNAHATISGNSSRQKAPPCNPARSFMTTSASASRSASAHLLAFSRKNGSCVPATRYVRGSGLGIMAGGL